MPLRNPNRGVMVILHEYGALTPEQIERRVEGGRSLALELAARGEITIRGGLVHLHPIGSPDMRPTIMERAIAIAREGKHNTIEKICRQLNRESYLGAHLHLSGKHTRQKLLSLCKEAGALPPAKKGRVPADVQSGAE